MTLLMNSSTRLWNRADELLNQGIELTRSLTAELNPVVLHEEGLQLPPSGSPTI